MNRMGSRRLPVLVVSAAGAAATMVVFTRRLDPITLLQFPLLIALVGVVCGFFRWPLPPHRKAGAFTWTVVVSVIVEMSGHARDYPGSAGLLVLTPVMYYLLTRILDLAPGARPRLRVVISGSIASDEAERVLRYYGIREYRIGEDSSAEAMAERAAGGTVVLRLLTCQEFLRGGNWRKGIGDEALLVKIDDLTFMPSWASLRETGGAWPAAESLPYVVGKRVMDVIGALFGLVLLVTLLPWLYLRIVRPDGGPLFHRRRVLAKHHGEFDALKLRTMRPDADAVLAGDPAMKAAYSVKFKLDNDPRVTPFGAVLRRISLDELPQVWNVLRGQMSLVGPRMIVADELSRYGEFGDRLRSVKPGISGLWQVSGRQCVGYEDRVWLDMQYIRDRDLWFDLWVAAITVRAVVTGRGAV
ncbi:sugar transferase [bacterium]|nr:sugar transferase [candidate division CSSED10-310 bacterium]